MISKITCLGFLFICLAQTVPAQNLRWVNAVGSVTADVANVIAVDNSGNVYITGSFTGTADFDPGSGVALLTSQGGTDIFLAKYGADGQYIWAKRIGGPTPDVSTCMTLDPAGNIYFAGSFTGTVNFNAGSGTANFTSNGGPDIFFAKYDANGNYLCARTMGGPANLLSPEAANGITIDAAGNVCLTGSFVGTTTNFNQGGTPANLASNGGGDIFLAKYDSNGNYLWAKGMGGSINANENGWAIRTDLSNNIYLTARFIGTSDFDPGAGVANLIGNTIVGNIALAKYDAQGNYIWAASLGAPGIRPEYTSLDLDKYGNIYLSGSFGGEGDFDPGTDTMNLPGGIFIARYDSNGNYVWAKNIGNPEQKGNVYGMTVEAASGTLYITGSFMGTGDFDPGPDSTMHTSMGDADIFVAKYNNMGDYLWSRSMGGADIDRGNGIAIDADTNIYLAGSFSTTAVFDPRFNTVKRSAQGNTDLFTLKFVGCEQVFSFSETACKKYVFHNNTYTAGGTYIDTLVSINHCDSIVVLDLTILDTVWHNITDTACDLYSFNGQTYTTSGTYTLALASPRGCDSILTLNLLIKKSTNSNISPAHYCDSVTIDEHTYTASGIYVYPYLNKAGCDSNITYDLSIGYSNSNTIEQTSCDRFAINDTVFTSSGIYTLGIFKNSSGCDSTVTLNLNINPSPVATVVKNGAILYAGSADHYQWIKCDEHATVLLSGATGQTYNATENGMYAVIISTDQGCSDTSDCVLVDDGTGIDQVDAAGHSVVHAYPNPVHNRLHLKTSFSLHHAVLTLTSITGQKLMQWQAMNGKRNSIDLTTLPTGFYFLEVEDSKHMERVKIIKE